MNLMFIHINIPHLFYYILRRSCSAEAIAEEYTHMHHYKPVDSTLSLSFIELATFDRSEEIWPHRTHKKM